MAEDRRDDDTKKQMRPTVFPAPQRPRATRLDDFRHHHEFDPAYTGPGRRCKTCNTVMP